MTAAALLWVIVAACGLGTQVLMAKLLFKAFFSPSFSWGDEKVLDLTLMLLFSISVTLLFLQHALEL